LIIKEIMWRRKGDSLARKLLIPGKLLILQLAELAKFAPKCGFGSFELQTRYSDSAIWQCSEPFDAFSSSRSDFTRPCPPASATFSYFRSTLPDSRNLVFQFVN